MVEPQHTLHTEFHKLAGSVAGREVVATVSSDKVAVIGFTIHTSNSGIRLGPSPQEGIIDVPWTTLAAILDEQPGLRPNLLRLNLQGHELQATRVEGFHHHRFAVMIVEMRLIPIHELPAFAELNRFFEHQENQLDDILPQYGRPLDGALWQLVAFDGCCGSALIASTAWS